MPIITGNYTISGGERRMRIKKQLLHRVIGAETTVGTPGFFWPDSSGDWRFGSTAPTTANYDTEGTALSAATGATTALSNLATVRINETLRSDAANTDDLGTDPVTWKSLYLGTSAHFIGGSFNYNLTFTEPSATRAYDFVDAGADGEIMINVGGANAIDFAKGTSRILFAANADLDIATGITVNIDNAMLIQGNLTVSATCTLDQDLQVTASPTFNALTVTSVTDGTATLTAGALSGITTITTTSHVSLDGNNVELRFGDTPATDSAIYFDGAGNLMLVDTNLGTARSLTELYTGTTLNPSVSGNLSIPDGSFQANETSDTLSYFKRDNATGSGPVLEIEQTHATGGVALLVDQNATGDVNAQEVTNAGTGYSWTTTLGATTGEGIEVIFATGGAGNGIFLDGNTGTYVGASGTGMLFAHQTGTLAQTDATMVFLDFDGTYANNGEGGCLLIDDDGTADGTNYSVSINSLAVGNMKLVTQAVGTTALTCVGPASQTAPIVLIDGDTGPWIGVGGSGMLELTSDGVLAATTTNLLRIEYSGNAGAQDVLGTCLAVVDSGAAAQESYAAYISSTNNNGLQIATGASGDINLLLTSSAAGVDHMLEVDGSTGNWVGYDDLGCVDIHSDAVLIAGSNLLRVHHATGAPATESHLVEIVGAGTWAGGTLGTCLNVTDTGNVAGTSYAVYISSTANSGLNIVTAAVATSNLVMTGVASQTSSMAVLDGGTGAGWEGGAAAGMLHLNAVGDRANAASTLLRISDVTGASPASGRGTSLAISDATTVGTDSWVAYIKTTANDGLLIETGHIDGKALWLKNSTAGVDCTLHVDGVTGTWVGGQDKGMILIDSDGTNAHADASLLRIAKTGETVASMNGSCLHIEDTSAGGSTAGYAAYINASGDLDALHIAAGEVLIADLLTCSSGLATKCDDTNISNGSAPTNAEAISAFGAAGTVGQGFIGMVDDNNAHANEALVVSDGTKYWYLALSVCA